MCGNTFKRLESIEECDLLREPKQGSSGQGTQTSFLWAGYPKQGSFGHENPKQVPLGGENSNKLMRAGFKGSSSQAKKLRDLMVGMWYMRYAAG
jgi:hypothetical protein